MLALDPKLAKKIGSYHIIAMDNKKTPVYAITSGHLKCRPCIMPDRPDKLLHRDDWLKYIRKYKLSNAAVRKLRSVWSLGAPSFESKSPKEMFAFKEIEEELLKRMRANYAPNEGNLFPWFAMQESNNSPDNVFLVGNTSCGKTTFVNKLLTNVNKQGENYATGRPVVIFSSHPDDPSLAGVRKLHKKRITDIDLDKIQGDIPLKLIEPGSLVIFDDCLELDNSDPRKRALYKLLSTIVTRGRHHKGKKGNTRRGTECICISHQGSRRELANVRNAAKWWVLFPNCSRTQTVHMLRARLHYTKRETEALLDRCGDSRWALFRMHSPQMVISTNHVEILR